MPPVGTNPPVSHAFLWCAVRPAGLSARVRELLTRPETRCAVSAVSFWELSLKHALGKLELTGARWMYAIHRSRGANDQ